MDINKAIRMASRFSTLDSAVALMGGTRSPARVHHAENGTVLVTTSGRVSSALKAGGFELVAIR